MPQNGGGGIIVPGAPLSTSSDGLPQELAASSRGENTIAANIIDMEVVEENDPTSVAEKGSARVGPKSFKDKLMMASQRERREKTKDEGGSDTNSESTGAATSAPPSIGGTPLPQRKGRGRPETTGEYRILKELKKRRLEEDERRDDEEIVAPTVAPRSKSTSMSRTETEFADEFKNTGALEIAATATEHHIQGCREIA